MDGVEARRRFRDRTEAGRVLARRLLHHAGGEDALVLALPRGGMPVAYEVASALRAPLDVFLVRKLGVPGHEELAMGAIASGGVVVMSEQTVRGLGIPESAVERAVATATAELDRREAAYRGDRPAPALAGRTVILVDDGLATGSTVLAAVAAARRAGAARVVVGVPVAAEQSCEEVRGEVDELVCAMTPEPFEAVGLWYEDFSQTSDEEVRDLLERAVAELPEVPR